MRAAFGADLRVGCHAPSVTKFGSHSKDKTMVAGFCLATPARGDELRQWRIVTGTVSMVRDRRESYRKRYSFVIPVQIEFRNR
jgi:hypothetical protein